jgi:sialate O-acetylesterase
MTPRFTRRVTIAASILLLAHAALHAKVTPAPLFRDHAVLQQGKPMPVWGTADAGEYITIDFADQKLATTAGDDGTWRVTLAPLKASAKPATLTLTGTNTVVVQDVLVGELWLASGQSNMNFKLDAAANAPAEIAAADFPLIRHFHVPERPENNPVIDGKIWGAWEVCSPATAGKFTAVGYFFARKLHQELGVPIGILHASYGGTDIEAWMSAESLARDPALAFVAGARKKRDDDYPTALVKYQNALAAFEQKAAEAKSRGETAPKNDLREPAKPGAANRKNGASLYNGMIAPFVPAPFAGVIWYQGENNVGRADQYRLLFPALITGWRDAFGRPDLPFYWVQLPNFKGYGGSGTTALREAQAAALVLPHTAQAIAIDVGESGNIHPKNKQDVGLRLALLALQKTYGKSVVASGPVFSTATFSGASARVTFTEIADGLVAKGGVLSGFTLAGADKKFVPAEARIEGDTVIVTAAAVPAPVAVRYAWIDDPVATLANSVGLPAAPFRSDTR